ncbi:MULTISPECIES: protein translocase subunit SecD [Psychrilyobacter]|uniref:Protein translocase subunit SecD n=1 Tax=Psychrilyobacter piezotolerans TaxID=2293438 RepID=A0ABX9KGH7_9FUSO|nr:MULTISPECIES: protein translocase subunit SecD [Psychrilyobacter]MCS5421525.1 protein translocase subunit SecD [Psychrilyobacter sp. S5]NDI77752.1 protein translocase subunit SecD [Psychrilyobacter piezotolerans]RDE61470.1 protein translocase subunit SecD [Psychrilyobacter sp. S5]REI40991.1 protein translocase subunit SecD [Psychrilyobacter piezotolerans]
MRKGYMYRIIFVAIVVLSAAWFTMTKPVKLGLDLKGGVYVLLEAKPEEGQRLDNEAMGRLIEVLNRRVNGLGVSESSVQKVGDKRVMVELPGITDTEQAIAMIGKTALMEFKIQNADGTLGKTLLTGKALKSAAVSYDNLGRPQISFVMNLEGAAKFAEITRNNIGKQLAITMDGVVQTAPRINSEIAGGQGVITGNYTVEEAKNTASLLNAGALPVKAEILETRSVGATLGDESIAQSKTAGMIAIGLIAVFMMVFYRLPGVVANLALICFGLITFATLNFFGATLTLPGIAGIILSVGMAVDANVIIFERIKEELRFGNTVMASIEAGFKKAFSTIMDSNITTLIITTILFTLGTGPVKGFAVTLTIGVLASMFTAITITKVLLRGFTMLFKIDKPILFGVRGK